MPRCLRRRTVERHRDALLRYVARRFRPDHAEDAVQEALLSAHRALIAGARPADARAWLATIAWRRAFDLSRREPDELPLDVVAVARSADDPETRAIQASELDRVVAAMAELPERQLTALKLSALEGRSLTEIGSVLDVGAETAKAIVARSRRTLTNRLAAAELDCGQARIEMEAAAARGVRLSGTLTLHIEGCCACARAHRSIRRRRRVALLIPVGLIVRTAGLRDRLRDLIALNPAWEAQAGAAKLCTAACLSLGAGAAGAPTVTVVIPLATQATSTPEAQRERPKPKPKARKKKPVVPKPTPTVARSTATPVPTPRATPVSTPMAKKQRKKRKLGPASAMIAFWDANPELDMRRSVEPTATPTPPVATPTPPPTG